MKKLNNKGFTLVELLAVIIILAIVVGVSIPAITNVINDSKNNSLGVAADSAEKFASEQYSLMSVNDSLVETNFKNKVGSLVTETSKDFEVTEPALLKAMGLDSTNITKLTMTIYKSGTVCITINEIPTTSQYYTTAHWNSGTSPKDTAQVTSKSCP